MALYKFYVTDGGEPKTGLAGGCGWESLLTTAGVDKSGTAPAITEIGGGWYKFTLTFGTSPFDVNELVGVIDTNEATMNDYDRYIPVLISLTDFAYARMIQKSIQTKATGDILVYDVDGSAADIKLDMTDGDTTVTMEPDAPA